MAPVGVDAVRDRPAILVQGRLSSIEIIRGNHRRAVAIANGHAARDCEGAPLAVAVDEIPGCARHVAEVVEPTDDST